MRTYVACIYTCEYDMEYGAGSRREDPKEESQALG